MPLSFLNHAHPMIAGIMVGQTPQELIAKARNAESDGAHGIAIDLMDVRPEYRNANAFKSIIDSVHLPFMFYFYRRDNWQASSDDDRQQVLLAAADAGASMIDVMGDLYDPSPMEITCNQVAIDRQKALIDTIHAKGADVVISSHMQYPRTTEQVIAHMHALEQRGADVVKIVTAVDTEDELAEAFRTTLMLRRELTTPFIHLCSGKFSRPHRFICPTLGVCIHFAVHRYEPNDGLLQPTIKAMKAVLDSVHWNINTVS